MKIRFASRRRKNGGFPLAKCSFRKGEHAEHFFVLLEGEISVWKKHGDQEIVVTRNRPGAFFGEIAAFTRHSLHAVRVAPSAIAG